jgi:predicted CoA-binding protein
MEKPLHVAVVGASPDPDRYSNMAVRRLKARGYVVVPVHPVHATVEGLAVARSLPGIHGKIHTVTMYVNARNSSAIERDLIALAPERVIFNPGAENPELAEKLRERGIRTVEACTLVLLSTGRFDTV